MMISTHTSSDSEPQRLARGWKTADCADVAGLSWLILAYTWSPIVWRDGRRCQANFLHADFLALDFDDPQFPLSHARRAFAGLTHVIGTTRNHQREKGGVIGDRYRVVVPFSERVTECAIYRHNVKLALGMFDYADRSCKDGARPFFACREIVEIEDDGDSWEVEALSVASEQKKLAREPESGSMRDSTKRWLRKWLVEQTFPKGKPRQPLFHDMGCALSRAGYSVDDAVQLVTLSPTMRMIEVGSEDWDRYRQAVRNGYTTVEREREGQK